MKMRVLLLLIFILVFLACEGRSPRDHESVAKGEESAVPVKVERVKARQLENYIRVTGTLEGIVDIVMTSETSGRVIAVNKKLGDWVNKGDEIGRVDNEQYYISLRQAEAAVLAAEAAFENAELQMAAVRELYDRESVSRVEYNQAQSNFKNAQAVLEGAKAGREAARKAYNNSRLMATVSGYIVDLPIELGEAIGIGQPVCGLVNSRRLLIKTGVGEGDVVSVKTGQRVIINHSQLTTPLEGSVTGVGIKPLRGSANYPVEIELENKDEELYPGMVVEARIISEIMEDVIFTSFNNLVKRYDSYYVFLVNGNNQAELREVSLARQFGENVIIENGLRIDELIVVEGIGNLEDGISVKVQGAVGPET
ncbi:efflux RND transporter periplasmic adaptor subunit [bacterium]|nr:efflux RND transporter periplasmic adaptor subunit [bacterium]